MKIKVLTALSLAVVLFLGACGGNSDAEMQTAATNALNGDTTTSGVTAVVNEGIATISGEVETEEAKNKAETLAKVEGVTSVTNNVTVKEAVPPPMAEGSDTMVKEKMETALRAKGCDGALVEVKDGVATLRGSVATAKYEECIMAANEAGAKKVENDLGKK
ncbi:MAG: BON domain-containing protein [Aridibacter sp.]